MHSAYVTPWSYCGALRCDKDLFEVQGVEVLLQLNDIVMNQPLVIWYFVWDKVSEMWFVKYASVLKACFWKSSYTYSHHTLKHVLWWWRILIKPPRLGPIFLALLNILNIRVSFFTWQRKVHLELLSVVAAFNANTTSSGMCQILFITFFVSWAISK